MIKTYLFQIMAYFYWIILPIGFGVFLLPFTPYFVKRKLQKKHKPLPSFIPFWGSIVALVLIMNAIWKYRLEGTIYHEWDHLFMQYSLVNYEHPILDGSGSWLAPGWQLWHLYAIWLGITISIYTIGACIALYINHGKKNFQVYKNIIITSCIIMTAISILTVPIFVFLPNLIFQKIQLF